ncbi:MAG: hypothetical protein AAFW70_18040, partial [Cyanobacteria bacterium J06635_10]
IKLKEDNIISYQQYIEGRHRYNRAASRINGLITQIIISIQAKSKITNTKLFQDQVIEAFRDSTKFQNYVETISKPSDTKGGVGTAIVDVLEKISPDNLINKLIPEISKAATAARKANSQQRAIIVCELKSLLLPDFDDVEANNVEANKLNRYPDDKCAKLIEKKDFTPEPDNQNPS